MKAIYSVVPGPSPAGGLARRPVTDVMSRPVASVSEEVPLGDALRSLIRLRRRHLVVVDGDGRCVGVLSDRAIAGAWARDSQSLWLQSVGTVLRTPPAVVEAQAKVLDVARLMRDAGVDAVVVVDAGRRPVGIVTGTDLVTLLAR